MRPRASAAGMLGVAAISPDGLLVRSDGACVRYLEVAAVNPLVAEPAEVERISASFAALAARLPDRGSLQLYVQGTQLPIPSQFLSMLPYLTTILVLVLISRDQTRIRLNAPACLGRPFHAAG